MQAKLNWNDLRYLLSVCRRGTLAAAARDLSVDQTTVARRLKALERDSGAKLLHRIDGRHVPTAAGETALAHAERIEEAAFGLLKEVGNRDAALSGTVRVTALYEVTAACLMPHFPSFRQHHPEIVIEFIASASNLSLTRHEADIAIRLARPDGGNIFMRKLANLGFAVYGAKHLVEGLDSKRLADTDWITYDDSLAHLPEARWMVDTIRPTSVILRSNAWRCMRQAARDGLGFCVLPCFMGDRDPELARASGPEPVISRELWLLVHPELRNTLRVRAVLDWLDEVSQIERPALVGREAA